LESNSGWVLLLRYEAYNFLGEWEKALTDAQTAVSITEGIDPLNHAQAVLALGRLQFNRGDYQVALHTLAKAEKLLLEVGDLGGVATVRAELAAYYLNRSELDQALSLYLKVDEFRRQINSPNPSDHTLLMLGVVYRKKREYQKAAEYLLQLLHRGKIQRNPGVIATACHHIAWLHVDQKNVSEAFRLATQARQLYLEVCDPRGLSDVDEQLGLITLINGDLDVAESYMKDSLNIRQYLGNQQGVASSLRHLSILYIRKGNIWLGLQYLCRSYLIYRRLGVLSRQRVFAIAKQFWQLAVVERKR
jgi:tetratricopeptide (TPR) repeat protein